MHTVQPLFLQHVVQKEKPVPQKCCYFCLPQGPKYSIIRETRRGRKYHLGTHGLGAATQRNLTDRVDTRLKTVMLLLTGFISTSSFTSKCQKRIFPHFSWEITGLFNIILLNDLPNVLYNQYWFCMLPVAKLMYNSSILCCFNLIK